jgi:sporulation protein YlmC with PRC-barrel domain
MARPVWPAAVLFAGVAIVGSPALAQECLEDMAAVDSQNVGLREHLSEQELRGYTTIRQAARFLTQNGREDACEELAETYAVMVRDRREELVEEGLMVELGEQERVDQLEAAPRVAELERPLSAGAIIGSDIRNLQNEDLGDITDVVIAPDSGGISHVLVESGGFLGMGENVVAVPLQALRVADNGSTFVLDMTRERFEEAPKVEEGSVGEQGWLDENDGYFMAKQ